MLKKRLAGAVICGLLSMGVASVGLAQTLDSKDYERAESFLSNQAAPLVDHAVQRVTWVDDGHFWYRDHDIGGDHFVLMDVATGQVSPAFDQAKLATALSTVTDKPVEAKTLPVSAFSTLPDGRLEVTVRGKRYVCDLKDAGSCVAKDPGAKTDKKDVAAVRHEPGVVSPDKSKEAFIRDWNLWVRDTAGGAETQLTTDGVENFGYATDNAGWQHSDKAIVVWSPDSKQIATFQQDQRKTGDMTVVSTNVGHPKVETWKYPLAGDKDVTMIERVVIDVAARHTTRFQMPPDQHRSSLCDDVACKDGQWSDVKWAPDSRSIAFVSTSRDHKHEWFRIADPSTGAVREVFEEVAKTYYESGNGTVNWQYLPETNEAIWFSERSNWGHLYLYDLHNGKLKHAITKGDFNVTEVLRVDPKTHTIWFRGVGKEKGRDPYYQHFYKVGLDGKGLTLLTPEDADHTVVLSPDRE
jgi:dipeptidyl-peptidase-4